MRAGAVPTRAEMVALKDFSSAAAGALLRQTQCSFLPQISLPNHLRARHPNGYLFEQIHSRIRMIFWPRESPNCPVASKFGLISGSKKPWVKRNILSPDSQSIPNRKKKAIVFRLQRASPFRVDFGRDTLLLEQFSLE